MQIISDNDRGKALARERPAAGFEIDRQELNAGASQALDAGWIAVKRQDRVTSLGKKTRMTPTATSKVKHPAARRHPRREPRHPGRSRKRNTAVQVKRAQRNNLTMPCPSCRKGPMKKPRVPLTSKAIRMKKP